MAGRAFDVTIKDGPQAFARRLSSSSRFVQQLEEATKRQKTDEMRRLTSAVKDEVEERVATLFNPREGRRHRDGVHLHGSFSCTVDTSTMPMTVILTSSADPAKVAALNYGANPHVITPNTKPYLWFPKVQLGNSYASLRRSQGLPARTAPGGRIGAPLRFMPTQAGVLQARGGGLIKSVRVNHPGIQASYFMELALERAVERTLRKTMRLPRG
jgi:hypothetical protein